MDDMDDRHPETELIAYLKDELPADAREAVTRHLDSCPSCRETTTAFRTLLDNLAHGVPTAPPMHWGRYRAELRGRLEARAGRRWAWWRRPLPVALSAGLATALVVFALLGPSAWREERRVAENLNGFEEVVLGTRLDLLREYPVVEHLDLLENLDVIRQLDRLTAPREG